jgi:hypothetical protein
MGERGGAVGRGDAGRPRALMADTLSSDSQGLSGTGPESASNGSVGTDWDQWSPVLGPTETSVGTGWSVQPFSWRSGDKRSSRTIKLSVIFRI